MNSLHLALVASALSAASAFAAPPEPKFRAEVIGRAEIGYGLAIADVDGDKRQDVLLADKKQIVWFQNPGIPPEGAQTFAPVVWKRHVIAENLTVKDNVCIAAQDLDGDGKCEVAVGAEWNPGDTETSGAVFYLIAPADRTQKWEPVKFPTVEPTTHRMRWLRLDAKEWGLVVAPLHGRGNKNAQGVGVKTLIYRMPADPRGEWKSEVVEDTLHATHNFELSADSVALAVGGREGIVRSKREGGEWKREHVIKNDGTPAGSAGVGELRVGMLKSGQEFIAAVEPMHGNQLAVYGLTMTADGKPVRKLLTDQLNEGHALACADVLGIGGMQIVVGFRGNPGKPRPIGLRLWTPVDNDGEQWKETVIDDENMACEDLLLADLDQDKDLDIIAAGRASKNVIIYWNDTKR